LSFLKSSSLKFSCIEGRESLVYRPNFESLGLGMAAEGLELRSDP
jgi:hypothetical protein